MKFEFGFIGCGNMGGALASAALKNVPSEKIALCNHNIKKANVIANGTDAVITDNLTIAENSRFIMLGVKPQMMADCISALRDTLKTRSGFVLVSMAAGLSINTITSMVGFDCPVIRIMPNTPAAVGCGMTPYCANDLVSNQDLNDFLYGLCYAGSFDALPEKLIDAASAVSGCGPAFVYMFIEALADGAVAAGLPRAKASVYAAQTVLGAAKMVLETNRHPGELKDAVCSPGGSTIQGVRALEEGAFRASVIDAVLKAYNRTVELGKV